MTQPLTVWAVTEGHIGTENQARGVAEALIGDGAGTIVVKRIAVRAPWRWLPPSLWPVPLTALGGEGDTLEPPWPDVLVSCGRWAAAPNLAVRKRSGGATLSVHIQRPYMPSDRFDLVVVPRHDNLHGANVHVTRAAVHRVTAERLAKGRRDAVDRADPARHAVTVLIGGSNRRHRFTEEIAARFGESLAGLCRRRPIDLRLTPSRRTNPAIVRILAERLAGTGAEIWDGSGDNPYFAWLAVADTIVVTWDSVSMTSEALATGKPVYVLPLEGVSRRIDRFHAGLQADGYTRVFDGALDCWTYDPPDDTAAAAAAIRARLQARHRAAGAMRSG